MRAPKGFGKRYFSLVAILAFSITRRLQKLAILFLIKEYFCFKEEKDELKESPPDILLTPLYTKAHYPCHCNCFFALRTKLAVALFHFIPRCPYYNTYFAFRRSGIHPPSLSFS